MIHRRLIFQREAPNAPAYANHYRFGRPTGPAPLIVFIGGATSRKEYMERSETEPLPIVAELGQALAAHPLDSLDAFICPRPLETGGEGLDYFIDHYDHELLPVLEASPASFACVGYSAGAGYATHLAIIAEAHALATFGGTGIRQAVAGNRPILEHRQRQAMRSLAVAIFRNASDQVESPQAVATLIRPLAAQAMPARIGGHKFADYAKNSTVRDALRFVIERI